MPKDGFKTITISEDIFNKLKKKYDDHNGILVSIGINSFSGFVSVFLYQMIESDTWSLLVEQIIKKNNEKFRRLA